MKISPTSITTAVISALWLLAITVPPVALCETDSLGNAQSLLDDAKKREFERKMAAKQTEWDRLSEDLKKGQQEIDELAKSISKVGAAATEAGGHLDKFAGEKKRLTQELDLVNLRIEAEKLKVEGLKLLSIAHTKAREALTKRNEEIDLRTAVVAAEMRQLTGKTSSEPVPPQPKGSSSKTTTKAAPTITELRKQLSKAEQAALNASSSARQAMEAATSKLKQAESAAAKADKKQAEVALEKNPSFPGGNDPLTTANQ
jgi:SMC interacting uncharacterized protein involved in chromosome segregation